MLKLDPKWRVLIVVCIGIFMSTLDGSIVNIANPSIAADFGISMQHVQWLVTAYMLVITASLLFFGKLGDRVGGQKIYTYGFMVFTIGSLCCAISPSLGVLTAARIFQGTGASMMMATGMGITSNSFPPEERGRALGITGGIVGIGNMAGPGLGGLVLGSFHWPAIFLINLPIGLIGFLMAIKYLPDQPKNSANHQYDIPGTVLFALAAILIVLSFSIKKTPDLWLLGSSLLLFFIFYRLEKQNGQGLLDFDLFKIRRFTDGSIMALVSYSIQPFVIFLMPFYLEGVLHYSTAQSGLTMSITPIAMAFTAPLAGSLSDRVGSSRLTPLSFFLIGAANLLMSTLNTNSSGILVGAYLALFGIGMGMFGSPNNNAILGSIPRFKAGYAGGFVSTIRNFSFALGTAVATGLFALLYSHDLVHSAQTAAYVSATRSVYYTATAICFLGMIFALISWKNEKDEKAEEVRDMS
ncbi:MAG: MFS transporter [Deltaproteobacteria bacterium]